MEIMIRVSRLRKCYRNYVGVDNLSFGVEIAGLPISNPKVKKLIADPPVLIYDEPASGLDPLTSHYIMELIGGMRGKKWIIL